MGQWRDWPWFLHQYVCKYAIFFLHVCLLFGVQPKHLLCHNIIIIDINQYYTQAKPIEWWENQHTVWGEIRDDKSLKVVDSLCELPVHGTGMEMLDQEIELTLELFLYLQTGVPCLGV